MTRHASLAAAAALLALAACRHGDQSAQRAPPTSRSAPVANAPGRGRAGSDRDAAPAGNAPAASDADRHDAAGRGGGDVARGERAPSRDAQAARPRSRYEVRGTVASAGGGLFGGNKLTIDRAGAPPAELRVGDDTRITLGGQPAKLSDLAEGDEVRATFDMDGDRAVATSIRAERTAPRGK